MSFARATKPHTKPLNRNEPESVSVALGNGHLCSVSQQVVVFVVATTGQGEEPLNMCAICSNEHSVRAARSNLTYLLTERPSTFQEAILAILAQTCATRDVATVSTHRSVRAGGLDIPQIQLCCQEAAQATSAIRRSLSLWTWSVGMALFFLPCLFLTKTRVCKDHSY